MLSRWRADALICSAVVGAMAVTYAVGGELTIRRAVVFGVTLPLVFAVAVGAQALGKSLRRSGTGSARAKGGSVGNRSVPHPNCLPVLAWFVVFAAVFVPSILLENLIWGIPLAFVVAILASASAWFAAAKEQR